MLVAIALAGGRAQETVATNGSLDVAAEDYSLVGVEQSPRSISDGGAEAEVVSTERVSRELFFQLFYDLIQGMIGQSEGPPPPPPPSSSLGSLPSTADFTPVRINCGGTAFTDAEGSQWLADAYNDGKGTPGGLSWWSMLFGGGGTPEAALYQTYRISNRLADGNLLSYNVPVPNGQYEVVLHFAKVFFLFPGWRKFNILVEGVLVFDSLDAAQGVGGPDNASELKTTCIVKDKELTIELVAINRNPYISAIEIMGVPDTSVVAPPTLTQGPTTTPHSPPAPPQSPAPTKSPIKQPTAVVSEPQPVVPITESPITLSPPFTQVPDVPVVAPQKPPTSAPVRAPTAPPNSGDFETILINAGGDAFQDFLGRTWMADNFFVGGTTYSDGRFDILGTQDDYIFQTERYGQFSYEIPVPEANYEVVIHLSELFFENPGGRTFNIAVEGTVVFNNVDIVQLGGGSNLAALSLETPQFVSDGFLSISFMNSNPKMDNPKVSGIEIKLVEVRAAPPLSTKCLHTVCLNLFSLSN